MAEKHFEYKQKGEINKPEKGWLTLTEVEVIETYNRKTILIGSYLCKDIDIWTTKTTTTIFEYDPSAWVITHRGGVIVPEDIQSLSKFLGVTADVTAPTGALLALYKASKKAGAVVTVALGVKKILEGTEDLTGIEIPSFSPGRRLAEWAISEVEEEQEFFFRQRPNAEPVSIDGPHVEFSSYEQDACAPYPCRHMMDPKYGPSALPGIGEEPANMPYID